MNTTLDLYREQRDKLLSELSNSLSKDERFVAAWLTGSFGRNDTDAVSDIDLSLVVSNEYSEKLCLRLAQISAQTSPERYSLFSQFGKPALIHENNTNAPAGGTFTFVLYAESALMVDWVLIPHSKAARPLPSKLLFEKVNLPAAPQSEPEAVAASRKAVAEHWAFFWMMTALTLKYILRGDSVFAAHWIENLHQLVNEIERRLKQEAWKYRRGSLSELQPTREKQLESIRELCNRMQGLKSRVSEFTGSEPGTPLAEIETLFSLAKK